MGVYSRPDYGVHDVGGGVTQIQRVVIWITDLRTRTDTVPGAECRLHTLADVRRRPHSSLGNCR
jgi:hypothetical protein